MAVPRNKRAVKLDTKNRMLSFEPNMPINIADRTYGFMRVASDKRATPFPRVEVGVDAKLLEARLKMEQMRGPSKMNLHSENPSQPETPKHGVKLIHSKKIEHDKMILDTPHPKKGLALDPIMLIKRLKDTHLTESPDDIDPSSVRMSVPSTLVNHLKERKKQGPHGNLTPINSIYKGLTLGEAIYMDDSSARGRKSKKHNSAGLSRIASDMTSQSVRFYGSQSSGNLKMDFYERRRLFYEAEFTIAKHGKKMSDYVMTVSDKPIIHKPEWSGDDIKAKEEIEQFIKKKGMQKISNDQLTVCDVRRDSDGEDDDAELECEVKS